MPRFARGERAWGFCQRCGDRRLLSELVRDGRVRNLLVCPQGCQDIKPPQEKPFVADDAIALRRPSPDVDDDGPGDSGQTLATAMSLTGFGGGT